VQGGVVLTAPGPRTALDGASPEPLTGRCHHRPGRILEATKQTVLAADATLTRAAVEAVRPVLVQVEAFQQSSEATQWRPLGSTSKGTPLGDGRDLGPALPHVAPAED
jgi:hypothetical protein